MSIALMTQHVESVVVTTIVFVAISVFQCRYQSVKITVRTKM